MGVKQNTYKLSYENGCYVLRKKRLKFFWIIVLKSKCKLRVLREMRKITSM